MSSGLSKFTYDQALHPQKRHNINVYKKAVNNKREIELAKENKKIREWKKITPTGPIKQKLIERKEHIS